MKVFNDLLDHETREYLNAEIEYREGKDAYHIFGVECEKAFNAMGEDTEIYAHIIKDIKERPKVVLNYIKARTQEDDEINT